ncbi:tRNA (adenosine(37)-N6)-threonylcarbamoyltransferase complex dimerization subunit type 1 TsaB [Hoeflea sp.]|uniref:tRNA (adenosine(37)-N6)-threonylcarbamoyltransferase complex dimerization subunit type 1 TsaB n=1 Tax=Hoeflea sp. TaxID=1940281 RepID=UPI003B02E559
MITLAVDTSAHLCAACLYDASDETVLARVVEDIGRGHAERLFPVIGAALRKADRSYDDLDRLAVCVGPGSFTGVRVGVSAMRGLALALSRPIVGVNVFEALIADAPDAGPVLIVLDARRNEVYTQLFDASGAAECPAAALSREAAAELAAQTGASLLGSGAPLLLALNGDRHPKVLGTPSTADIASFAKCGAAKASADVAPGPLYLRGADAKPQSGFVLPREEMAP